MSRKRHENQIKLKYLRDLATCCLNPIFPLDHVRRPFIFGDKEKALLACGHLVRAGRGCCEELNEV